MRDRVVAVCVKHHTRVIALEKLVNGSNRILGEHFWWSERDASSNVSKTTSSNSSCNNSETSTLRVTCEEYSFACCFGGFENIANRMRATND
jgi:hypothetical protein